MTKDTDELIETLERLEKEATPGPFIVSRCASPEENAGEVTLDALRSGGMGEVVYRYKWIKNAHDPELDATLRNHLPALISALKENKRLREALSDATEAIIMMSGSSDFASDGQAGAWWTKFRDEKFYPAILFLTTTAALQPQGDAKP